MGPNGAMDILLVDDNPADADLARVTFAEGKVPTRLFHAIDGIDALKFLRREGTHGAAPRPDLIVLDLNMPRMDGRELLAQIKADQDLRRIPVVVLTTSKAETDIARSYDLHANCYLTKPVELDEYIDVARSIEEFWLRRVRLPRR